MRPPVAVYLSIQLTPSIYFAGYGICGRRHNPDYPSPLPLSTRATNGHRKLAVREQLAHFYLPSPFLSPRSPC
ncbi:hypothetical protein F4818DRAFT_424440 [Hypoxylon cercidicola]|nr:hypothetical protein F4818DRAFT_424440 [Hypoxylon cercidicola]